MKVAWNICDKELGSEMKSVKENCLNKSSLVNLRNSIPLREIYSVAIRIVYLYIFTFLYQFAMKSKACDTNSIHL